MRFLCVACDEAMALKEAQGAEGGSLTVLFSCPACGQEVAMLANAMETQLVRALGVKIGGRTAPAAPMEVVRTSLAERRDVAAPGAPAPAASEAPQSGSRCPFTGVVEEALQQAAARELGWTRGAEERLQRIPPFARSMVRQHVEAYAREQGLAEVDEAVMDEVKSRLRM